MKAVPSDPVQPLCLSSHDFVSTSVEQHNSFFVVYWRLLQFNTWRSLFALYCAKVAHLVVLIQFSCRRNIWIFGLSACWVDCDSCEPAAVEFLTCAILLESPMTQPAEDKMFFMKKAMSLPSVSNCFTTDQVLAYLRYIVFFWQEKAINLIERFLRLQKCEMFDFSGSHC